MQPTYPYYAINASGSNETGVSLEVRVEIGAGGGLTGFEDEGTVLQAIAGMFASVEGTTVRITATSLKSDPVPVP